jgi:hypothetical protein
VLISRPCWASAATAYLLPVFSRIAKLEKNCSHQ